MPYNWRPSSGGAYDWGALGCLIIEGPWRPYSWKPLEAV